MMLSTHQVIESVRTFRRYCKRIYRVAITGTAELEAVLDHADEVSETAVVGFPHEIKGEGIVCYVVLKEGVQPTAELTK